MTETFSKKTKKTISLHFSNPKWYSKRVLLHRRVCFEKMTCRVQEYDVCFFGYFQSDFEKRPVHTPNNARTHSKKKKKRDAIIREDEFYCRRLENDVPRAVAVRDDEDDDALHLERRCWGAPIRIEGTTMCASSSRGGRRRLHRRIDRNHSKSDQNVRVRR